MGETFEEFKSKLIHTETRKHKVTKSWGTYDYYKLYRKNKPKDKKYVLSESLFFAIVRRVNLEIVNLLLTYARVELPYRSGELVVYKYDRTPRIDKDGNLRTNTVIDWHNTLKLWYDDEESYRDKTLVYSEDTELFKVHFYRANARFPFKTFYEFKLNTTARSVLSLRLKDGKLDGFYPRYKGMI